MLEIAYNAQESPLTASIIHTLTSTAPKLRNPLNCAAVTFVTCELHLWRVWASDDGTNPAGYAITRLQCEDYVSTKRNSAKPQQRCSALWSATFVFSLKQLENREPNVERMAERVWHKLGIDITWWHCNFLEQCMVQAPMSMYTLPPMPHPAS